MPARLRGPIGDDSNQGLSTPGPLVVSDNAEAHYLAAPGVPGPLGAMAMAEAGMTVLAQAGGTLSTKPQKPSTPQVKTLKMPTFGWDHKTKRVRTYSWKLYGKTMKYVDVHQQTLMNCALAGLLSALAHTSRGRKHLQTLITEHKATVETDVSAVSKELAPPRINKITSKRFFTVSVGGKSFEVSDVFYTDDADRGWTMIYMSSPSSVLWPCVIEKAYAKKVGGYSGLDAVHAKNRLSLNDFWEQLCRAKPEGFSVNPKTAHKDIRKAAKAAVSVPTVAVSKSEGATSVASWHSFAVLGWAHSKVKLYDPMYRKEVSISLNDFTKDFQAVLYGNPQ